MIDYNGVKFYHPDICSFGSFHDEKDTFDALNEYAKLRDSFFIVSENKTPIFDSENIVLVKKIDGCQMILDQLIPVDITEEIVRLTDKHIDEVYDLVWLVMPGFYERRSFEMGEFYGIFKDNKLVSITGQRLQSDYFIELSSVVTHPDYTRKGLAKQLITYVTNKIIAENKLTILHTNKGNPAIGLYEKLGFYISRDMNWLLFNKK